MIITLNFFESGALASIYRQALNSCVTHRSRKTYNIGQEVLNHSVLCAEIDVELAQKIHACLKQETQTYMDLNNALLKLFGVTMFLNDQVFGILRVELGNDCKTAYNLHTLNEFKNSFMNIAQHGGFTFRASHRHVGNTFDEEILAVVDLLTAKPLNGEYRVHNLKEDNSITFTSPRMTFKLISERGTALNKKTYTYRRVKDGEFIRLKVLQADRLGVIPCVNLCRFLARFLECITDGYHNHDLLEFNKDVADKNITVSEILSKYDYDKLVMRPFSPPVVQGIFE